MRRLAVALALVPLLTACSEGEGERLPAGSFAGSTATDRAFTVDVGDEVRVNGKKARFVERGVIEVKGGDVRTTLTCKVQDRKGEELRCTVETAPPTGRPTTEVIDLMLL